MTTAESSTQSPRPAPKARPRARKGQDVSCIPAGDTERAAVEISAPLPAPPAVEEPAQAPEAPAKPARGRKTAAASTKAAKAGKEAEAAPVQPQEAPAATDPALLVTDQARAVLQAIQEGRAVELLFVDVENYPPRTFEPRQLIFDTFAKGWYVWGWDRRYNAERHHLLSLVAQVNPVEGMGRAAQGPYKEGTPANLIGGWLGGEPIHVKAVLLKQWIFAVRQAPAPFPDFVIEDLEEGKAQVSFTGTDLRAITRWVMQFGDGIQVLEPQRLLDRVKQVGLAWGGRAQAAPVPTAPVQQPKPAPARPEHRAEHKPEHKPEHRAEHRFETRPEPAPERKGADQPKQPRESHETSKPARPNRFEIRIDRL
jgi:predicted DNA-binding transcriptional regulator YafY